MGRSPGFQCTVIKLHIHVYPFSVTAPNSENVKNASCVNIFKCRLMTFLFKHAFYLIFFCSCHFPFILILSYNNYKIMFCVVYMLIII